MGPAARFRRETDPPQYDLPKAKFLYNMAVDKITSAESDLRKKADETARKG